MIRFKNGHQEDFFCASGALAWYGEGWAWEYPLRWLGYIRPDQLTVISKTLTFLPRKGNLKWWCPWRCVKLIEGGAVNAVGLTNPGYEWWLETCVPQMKKTPWQVIVSLMPQNKEEAATMAKALEKIPIVGIELNVSCPNVDHDSSIQHVKDLVDVTLNNTNHPVIVKLGYTDPYLDICKELDQKIDAFDLINTVPWKRMYNTPSPLAKYNLEGGISGGQIKPYAREVLAKVKDAGIKTPVISGGGIDSVEELLLRRDLKADGYSIGTLFLRQPWLPRTLINEFRSRHGA